VEVSKFDMNLIPEIGMKKIHSVRPEYTPIDVHDHAIHMDGRNKGFSNVFEKLMKYAKNLEGKLQEANSKLYEKDKDIELMQKISKMQSDHEDPHRVHFAFLFSSPLVRFINNKMQNIMQLNCMSELDDIQRVISDLDYELKFKS
jgi:hypothetical protein